MFWTDWGSTPKIERSTLNGTQRITIVTSNIRWPNGIDLDRRNHVVYWADAGTSRVESSGYHGNNRKIIYEQSQNHFYGVTFFSPYLYVSEWYKNAIIRLKIDQGNVTPKVYSLSSGILKGLVAFDSSRQPSGKRQCHLLIHHIYRKWFLHIYP